MKSPKHLVKILGITSVLVIATVITWTLRSAETPQSTTDAVETTSSALGSEQTAADESAVVNPDSPVDSNGARTTAKSVSHEVYLAQWKDAGLVQWTERIAVLDKEEKAARLVERANLSQLNAEETQRLREIILESAALSFLQAEYQLDALDRKLESP